MPYISKKNFEKHMKFVEASNELLFRQNKQIVELNTKIKHLNRYIEFLEGCIKSRVDVDFPNSHAKGGNTANTGSRLFNSNSIFNSKE